MKKIFWYVLIIFIIMVVITLTAIIDKSIKPKENTKSTKDDKLEFLNNIDKKIDYFNYSYLDRYISYRYKYPNLSDVDIVTRVNLGLDKDFYEDTKESTLLNKINILVNKYIYLPSDYIPNNLVTISSKYSVSNKMLVYEAKEAFEQMAQDAKERGYTIRAISAYRSYDYQKQLYDSYLSKDSMENVDTYSARPGYSEHQTGLVIDVDNKETNFENFESTKEFTWMENNAQLYGFILRYPKDKQEITGYTYESWHYRYVGKEIATYIKNNNITFDEYYVRFIDK